MTLTPLWIEGFEHEVLDVSQFGADGVGIFDTLFVNDGTALTYQAGRLGGSALRIIENGVTAAGVRRNLVASQHRVCSVYFKVPTPPSATSDILLVNDVGTTLLATFRVVTGTGVLQAKAGTLGVARSSAANVCDDAWHRLDFWADFSCTTGDLATWVIKWEVDGVAGTDATVGTVAAADSVRFRLGTATNAHTATVTFDDLVTSATAVDYPIGPHHVVTASPTSDGTHNSGTNIIEDNVGNDISTPAVPAFSLMDDMPVASTTDYVRQQAAGSTNYAAVKFAIDPADAGEIIGGVEAWMAGNASSTTAETGNPTTRIVDSSGTTLVNVYSGDMSETGLHYRGVIVPPPSSTWDNTDFNGLQARVGFRSDAVGGHPRWHALWMTVLVLEPATGTLTQTATAIVSRRFTKTHSSDARIGVPIVTKTHTTTAIISKTGNLKQHTSDAEIAGGPSRRTNSFEGGTNLATVTSGNSGGASGDAFQDVTIGAGSTNAYDSLLHAHGLLSGRIDPATTVSYYGYTTGLGTQTSIYGRAYVYLTSLPVQGITIALAYETPNVQGAAIGINSAGRLRLIDSAGVQQAISVNNPSGIVPLNQWFRLEWHFFASATVGSIEVRLYLSADSTTIDSTTSATNINTFTSFSRYRIGKTNTTGSDEVALNVDEIGWDTAGFLGVAADRSFKSHTSDAIIKKTSLKTHLSNAIILKTATKTHTTDARILLRPTPFHTSDAIIQAPSNVKSHTSDAFIMRPSTLFQNADAQIVGGFTPVAGAWVVVDVAARRATGTVPPPTVTDTIGSAVIREQEVQLGSTFLGRYYMKVASNPLPRSVNVSFGLTVMQKILVEVYQILGVDGSDPFVRTYNSPHNESVTSIEVPMVPYDNAANRGLIAVTHSFDEVSDPEAGWNELIDLNETSLALAVAWSDAEDDTATYSWATGADAIAISSEIQVLRTTEIAHTSDAFIKKSFTKTHTSDAQIFKASPKTHTTDAFIASTGVRLSFDSDAYIWSSPIAAHNTDAVIFKRLLKSHTTTAIITSEAHPASPPIPVPVPGYRLALASTSNSGLGTEIISDILALTGVPEGFHLTWEETLNEAGRMDFSLPIDHEAVTRANFAVGKREIHVHRGDGDDLVWAGTLEVAEVSNWEVRFIALGWYDKLSRRTIKQDYSSRSVFNPQTGWTYKDQYQIVREMLAILQAESPLGLDVYNLNEITGVTRRLTVCEEERRLFADVIDEFAAASNGFDFAVLPDKTFRMWFPRRDSGGAITVDGTRTFSEVTYQIDASDIVTRVSGIGPTQDCDEPDTQMLPPANQTTQEIIDYGVSDGSIDLKDNWDDDHRLAIIEEALQNGDHPRFQTDIIIETALVGAPEPIAYGVGDSVTLTASRGAAGGFGSFTLQARILKRKISVDTRGLETTTITVDVEGGL